MPWAHRGESGRARDIILTLLNPGLLSLLLRAVRGSWEIYWCAANLQRASSKPHNLGSDFTKISQSNKSEASPSTICSHKLWFLVGRGTVKGLAGPGAFLAFPKPTGSTSGKGEHPAPVMSLHWLRGTHTKPFRGCVDSPCSFLYLWIKRGSYEASPCLQCQNIRGRTHRSLGRKGIYLPLPVPLETNNQYS